MNNEKLYKVWGGWKTQDGQFISNEEKDALDAAADTSYDSQKENEQEPE